MNISSEENPRWAWFAHHQLALVIAAISIVIVGDLLGNPLINLSGSALMCAFLIGSVATTKHTGILCGRCIDKIPTDGAVLVKRRDWALRLRHQLVARPWVPFAIIMALIVVDMLLVEGAAVSTYIIWPWFALDAWTVRFHGRVAPWCPYCRNDGWGDHAHSPDPQPTGTKAA